MKGGIDKMKYKTIIKRDDDGWYIAECPAIPGCVSQGRTLKEIKENIKDAITDCLEVLNKRAEREKAKHKEELLYEVSV